MRTVVRSIALGLALALGVACSTTPPKGGTSTGTGATGAQGSSGAATTPATTPATTAAAGTSSGGSSGGAAGTSTSTTATAAASSGSTSGSSRGGSGTTGGGSTGSAGGASSSGGSSGGAPDREYGVFVPTFGAPLQGSKADPTLVAELGDACVDGFVLVVRWADVQPTLAGAFDFSALDADVATVAQAGKKAAVEIQAGVVPSSPSWVCDSAQSGGGGAACLSLVQALDPSNAPNTSCAPVLLPVPWDSTFQTLFGQAVAALTAHLAASANAATVVELKVTGINDASDETDLPTATKVVDIGCSSGSSCQLDAGTGKGWCAESDAVALMTDAGYSTQAMQSAFDTFAQDFRSGAPGVTLGAQVSSSLPNPGAGDLAEALVDGFLAGGFAPITVQDNGLRAVGGVDPGALDAVAAGVPVGFQEYLAVAGDTACKMSLNLAPGPDWDGGCGNEQVLDITVWNALDAGASFLELYKQDVQTFPNACAMAHAALVP